MGSDAVTHPPGQVADSTNEADAATSSLGHKDATVLYPPLAR